MSPLVPAGPLPDRDLWLAGHIFPGGSDPVVDLPDGFGIISEPPTYRDQYHHCLLSRSSQPDQA